MPFDNNKPAIILDFTLFLQFVQKNNKLTAELTSFIYDAP